MRLLIEDEFGEIEKILGYIAKKDINVMANIAEDHNLKCLSFVDIVGNTYFSEKQLLEIKKNEIEILENNPKINKSY